MSAPDRSTARKRSIEDGVLVRTSPSQIETFQLCARKWWYDKVAKFPRKPESKSQRIGTDAHNELAHFFVTGEDVRGEFARSGDDLLDRIRHRLPYNGGDALIEAQLDNPCLMTDEGVLLDQMFADVILPPTETTPTEVIDHKFRSDLVKYGATVEKLWNNTQVLIYAMWALLRWPGEQRVIVTHHEHQTRGRLWTRAVSAELPAAHVLTSWRGLERVIDRQMRVYACAQDPEKVPGNESACMAYGGCDFAAVCSASPAAKLRLRLLPENEEKMGLLDSLEKKKAEPIAPAGPSAPGVPASQAKEGKTYKLPDGRVATVQAVTAAGVFLMDDAGAACRVDLGVPLEEVVVVKLEPPPPAPAAVLPPDAPPSNPASPTAAVRDTRPEPEPEARIPGVGDNLDETKTKPRTAKKAAEPAQPVVSGLTLFVNCSVVGAKFTNGDQYVAALAAQVAKAAGVDDVRFVPKDNPLAYGAWRGALARAAIENPPSGYVLFTTGELADPVIEALAAKAAMVVRGGR